MALNWNMIPALAGAEGAGTGYTQGMSNYLNMMNQMMYRRSEIERNTAMAQAYNNRYGQGGLSQQGIDERTIAAILRANPGMTYGQAVGQMGGGGVMGAPAQPDWVNRLGGTPMQGDGSAYAPPWMQQATQPQPVADLGGMPAGTAPPTPGASTPTTPMASPPQSGGPVSTAAITAAPQAPPNVPIVPGSNPVVSMLMTAAKYANQPGVQPGQATPSSAAMNASGAATPPNYWYNGQVKSPLAPVGGQGGFDFGQADASTAQGALETIRRYQSLLQDPNAPQDPNSSAYWQYQGMLRQGAPAYKEAITALNDVQNRHTQGLTAMLGAGKDVAAATDAYNSGKMNGADYAQLVNYYRSQGVNYDPAMRPVNAGLTPQQMNNLATAAEKGTLTPAQQRMIPQGYTLAKDDQGNPVFVDKNGVEQEVGSGLTPIAQTRLTGMEDTNALREANLQYLQQIKMPEGSLTMKLMQGKLAMQPEDMLKLQEQVKQLVIQNQYKPAEIEATIKQRLASAGYLNQMGQWVGPRAKSDIARNYSQVGSSQTRMSQAEMEALSKKEASSKIMAALTEPQKDPMTGQPIPGTERVKVGPDGTPQGSPADIQAYNGAKGDYQKFNEMAFQQGQRASRPVVQPTSSGTGGVADALVGRDYGKNGCANGVCAIASKAGVPVPKTAVARVFEARLPATGWVQTNDPNEAQLFTGPGSGPSGRHVGWIENGHSYQSDHVQNGKAITTMQQYDIPTGSGYKYWKYTGKSSAPGAATKPGGRSPAASKFLSLTGG